MIPSIIPLTPPHPTRQVFAELLLYAIGTDGDVLPNEDKFTFTLFAEPTRIIILPNPERICQLALQSVLDMRYEITRPSVSPMQRVRLERAVRNLQVCNTVLNQYINAIRTTGAVDGIEDPSYVENLMGKFHSISHYSEIAARCGPLGYVRA